MGCGSRHASHAQGHAWGAQLAPAHKPFTPHPPPHPRSFVIKKTEQRYNELSEMGISVRLICVGRKGSAYFKRRPQYNVEGEAAHN